MNGWNGFPYLTTKEAAAWLNVHPHTIRRWCDSGELPCERVSGRNRAILKTAVNKLILRKFFGWSWQQQYRFMLRFCSRFCLDCSGGGVCAYCNGAGCDNCWESDEIGICPNCNGSGDYLLDVATAAFHLDGEGARRFGEKETSCLHKLC